MAKLRDETITKDDINEYLRESSDFGFEIIVLRRLAALGFACEHAGTYGDPITNKTSKNWCQILISDLFLINSIEIRKKNYGTCMADRI